MSNISEVKIVSFPESESIQVNCPCCDNWTEQSNFDPRRKIHSFDILKWYDDKQGQDEKSLMNCLSCTENFILVWDYENEEK